LSRWNWCNFASIMDSLELPAQLSKCICTAQLYRCCTLAIAIVAVLLLRATWNLFPVVWLLCCSIVVFCQLCCSVVELWLFCCSVYGDSLFMMIQNTILVLLVLGFSGQTGQSLAFMGVQTSALWFLFSGVASFQIIWGLQAANMPIVVISKVYHVSYQASVVSVSSSHQNFQRLPLQSKLLVYEFQRPSAKII